MKNEDVMEKAKELGFLHIEDRAGMAIGYGKLELLIRSFEELKKDNQRLQRKVKEPISVDRIEGLEEKLEKQYPYVRPDKITPAGYIEFLVRHDKMDVEEAKELCRVKFNGHPANNLFRKTPTGLTSGVTIEDHEALKKNFEELVNIVDMNSDSTRDILTGSQKLGGMVAELKEKVAELEKRGYPYTLKDGSLRFANCDNNTVL